MKVRRDGLDALVSEYIRKRSGGYCQRCGRYYGWQRLQACHFHSRRKRSVRYDEDNLAAFDFGCHQYLDSHPLEKIDWFRSHLGEEEFNLLLARARIPGKPDRNGLRLYFREKIRGLEG